MKIREVKKNNVSQNTAFWTKTIDRSVWFCHRGFGIVINKNTIIRGGGVYTT